MSLSPKERNALKKYVEDLAARLWLQDWTIVLSDEPSEPTPHGDESAASISTVYGRKRAVLKLGRNWHNFDAEGRRHTLTHELIHIHTEGMDDVMYYSVRKQLAPSTWDVVFEEFRRKLEFAVDGLADAIAPLMPLPPA